MLWINSTYHFRSIFFHHREIVLYNINLVGFLNFDKKIAALMGIDKDIKQAKFRNNQNKAMVNIMFTHAWMLDHIKSFVKTENITPQQYNILRILRSAGEPLSTLQLRERMLDKMSDTSRIVDRLITKGLVKKLTCKTDRRLVDVIISDKGKKLLEKLDLRQKEMDDVLGHLSENDANILSGLLDKIRDGGE